jgi:hypothetical protein
MSTRPDDRLVNLLSHWLARHVDDDELRTKVDAVDPAALAPHQRDALEELRAAVHEGDGGDLEMVVRETLESLALG